MSVLIEVDSTKEGPNSSWNMDGILDERSDLSLILTDEWMLVRWRNPGKGILETEKHGQRQKECTCQV